MADTIEQIILDVQAICPDVDPNLARLWVQIAARRTMEFNQWSWLLRRGQFVIPASVTNVSSSATVTVTAGSNEIEFSSGIVTEAYVGRQFRTTTSAPVYDIVGYVSSTKARIYPEWGGSTASAQGFTVFKSRLELPSDFSEFVSATSPLHKWQLWLNVSQDVLDGNDPARNRASGNPCVLSPLDYANTYSGSVDAAVIASGSGNKPVSSGEYTGDEDAIYTIQVTTGGVGGTAVFKWKKDEAAFTTGVTSDAVLGNQLSDGVVVSWDSATTFTLNDIFVIRTHANRVPGSPRVELYPYSSSSIVIPYLYVCRYPDVTDENVQLPGALAHRGDIILEKALEFASAWQGTEDRPNTANQINRRDYHGATWLVQISQLVRQDNALFQRAVLPSVRLPFAPWPFAGGGNLQEYDPPYMYPIETLY
jgi:hypothetical protein